MWEARVTVSWRLTAECWAPCLAHRQLSWYHLVSHSPAQSQRTTASDLADFRKGLYQDPVTSKDYRLAVAHKDPFQRSPGSETWCPWCQICWRPSWWTLPTRCTQFSPGASSSPQASPNWVACKPVEYSYPASFSWALSAQIHTQ